MLWTPTNVLLNLIRKMLISKLVLTSYAMDTIQMECRATLHHYHLKMCHHKHTNHR
jgi:hypothetical protein